MDPSDLTTTEENPLLSRLSKIGLAGSACKEEDKRYAVQCKDCHTWISSRWHKTKADLDEELKGLRKWYASDLGNDLCGCGYPCNALRVCDINLPRHITRPEMLLRAWIRYGIYRDYAWRWLLLAVARDNFSDIVDVYPLVVSLRCDRKFLRQVCAIDKNETRVEHYKESYAQSILNRYAFVESVLGCNSSASDVVKLFEDYVHNRT